jgi:hypothetical protein
LARSIASLIPTPKLRHILPALVLLRKPLYGLAKRRKQPGTFAASLSLLYLRAVPASEENRLLLREGKVVIVLGGGVLKTEF